MDDDPRARPTLRQMELLKRHCRGETTTEISKTAGISQTSVSCALRNAYDRMGLKGGDRGYQACWLLGRAEMKAKMTRKGDEHGLVCHHQHGD